MSTGARSLADLAWPRRTARLVLRPARLDDAPAVFTFRRRDDVSEWLDGTPATLGEMTERWSYLLDCSVVVLLDGAIVGTGKIDVEDAWGQREVLDQARRTQAELGWILAPHVHGRGIGTELAAELLAIALDLGVRRVTALAFADHTASVRVMEKIGMRREALYRKESLHRTRGWVDGVLYAVLAEEIHP